MVDIHTLYALFTAGHPVATDSRKVTPGSIFFALRGDHFDGNAYAAGALEAGAVAAVVDDPGRAVDGRYIVVADVLKALQALARHHRRQLGIPVLAITGSNGKTTTKELIARVLSKRFRVSATQGNLNNHIGVPLTLLAIAPGTEFAVVEMGANHRGEIASYCAIAEPDYGLITNIGKAHLEGFGGEEGIRLGKGELFDWLDKTGGTAFYSEESYALRAMVDRRPTLTAYGFSAGALLAVPTEDNLLSMMYGGRILRTRMAGEYNRYNVAAALAVGKYFETDPAEAAAAIESYEPDNLRSQRIVTEKNILYLDTYNANPSSTAAALENFAGITETGYEKTLILGEMRELGEYAEAEHRAVIEAVRRLGFTEVFWVGGVFRRMNTEKGFRTFADTAELAEHLKQNPLHRRVILIKGSRGVRLETLVPEL
jgi:UDP-N-acetylmuramoyl-tripeptide--D-alanyl-D-alanine ligase